VCGWNQGREIGCSGWDSDRESRARAAIELYTRALLLEDAHDGGEVMLRRKIRIRTAWLKYEEKKFAYSLPRLHGVSP